MKNTREVAKKIVKLQLSNQEATKGVKEAILKVAPEYPVDYFERYFKEAHEWTLGKGNLGKGPGTIYILGYLDAALELDFDITPIIVASEQWQTNNKRNQAIKEWLTKNI